MHRYDETARLVALRERLREEQLLLVNLKEQLVDFKPPDSRRYRTHYDYANFTDISAQDIRAAIQRAESRIRDTQRQIDEAERRDGLTDDEILDY